MKRLYFIDRKNQKLENREWEEKEEKAVVEDDDEREKDELGKEREVKGKGGVEEGCPEGGGEAHTSLCFYMDVSESHEAPLSIACFISSSFSNTKFRGFLLKHADTETT